MSGPSGASGPVVLVAEASRTLATLIRLTLQADGYQPHWVSSGREALSFARQHEPAMAIVDAGLRDLGGYDVVDALRAQESTQQMPVLMLHHDYDTVDHSRLTRARVDDVMAKPFERQALLTRVRALLPHVGNAPLAMVSQAKLARIERLSQAPLASANPRQIFERSATAPLRSLPQAPPPLASASERPPVSATAVAPVEELTRGPSTDGAVASSSNPPLVSGQPSPAVDPSALEAMVGRAVDVAVAEALAGFGAKLEARLDERLQQALDTEVRQLVKNNAESIVWKTVGELTEDLIREEIERLTANDP